MRLILSLSELNACAFEAALNASDGCFPLRGSVVEQDLPNLVVDVLEGPDLLPAGLACDDGIIGWWIIEGADGAATTCAFPVSFEKVLFGHGWPLSECGADLDDMGGAGTQSRH